MLAFSLFGDFTWPLVPIVAAVVILLFASHRRIKAQGRPSQAMPGDKLLNLSDRNQIKSDLQRLVVELQELARQINGHIDTRFCKLEVLIKQADERIRKLERLTGQESDESKGQGEDRCGDESSTDPEREVIYKLADKGKGPVEIARELNKHPGEVELILSLRRAGPDGNKVDYRIE